MKKTLTFEFYAILLSSHNFLQTVYVDVYVYMVCGERCLNIKDVCMDFEPCFKVNNLVSVHPISLKLGQMTNLNAIFHVVVSIDRSVKI